MGYFWMGWGFLRGGGERAETVGRQGAGGTASPSPRAWNETQGKEATLWGWGYSD